MADERIIELIVQRFYGTISPEGQEELNQWAGESPENQHMLETRLQPGQLATELIDLLDDNENYQTGRLPRPRLRAFNGWRTAALWIFAIAGIGTLILTRQSSKKETTRIVTDHPEQAQTSRQIILTLSNGATIRFDTANEKRLSIQEGWAVVKETSRHLAYLESNTPINSYNTPAVYNTLSTTAGSDTLQVSMPGARALLYPGSGINFPLIHPGQTGSNIVVTTWGKVIFDVDHNASIPYSVKAGNLKVDVLGTMFSIDTTGVTLYTGKVKVTNTSGDSVILHPSQKAIVAESSLRTQTLSPAVLNASWQSNTFDFTNRSIGSVMEEISKWYGMDRPSFAPGIDTVNGRIGNGSLPRALSLSKLLRLLENDHLHFTIQGQTIVVTK